MASYYWLDHPSADFWRRYADSAVNLSARLTLEHLLEHGSEYVQQARTHALDHNQPEPDELEVLLDLLLNARVDSSQSNTSPIFIRNLGFDGLIALRKNAGWGGTTLSCPRIFVSHRQKDDQEGLRIAKIASEEGFQFWLDILDPPATWLSAAKGGVVSPRGRQLLVAVVVEMALLNCSHVIALITPEVAGSAWIPYEYGRVKDSGSYSLQAGCWLHPGFSSASWEYLLLGVETRNEDEIRAWLSAEVKTWGRRYGNRQCRALSINDWKPKWGEPARLPGS